MLDLKSEVIRLLSRKEDPVKMATLLKEIGLGKDDRQYLRSLLSEMVRQGEVQRWGNRYWAPQGKRQAKDIKREKSKRDRQTTGRLSLARNYGFVEVENGEDWIVPRQALGGAKHGDIVRARKKGMGRGGRTMAEVVEIEEFGTDVVLGVFELGRDRMVFEPFQNYRLDPSELGAIPREAQPGSVGKWSRREDGRWVFGGILGSLADPAVDEGIVLAENGIEKEFSSEVAAEAERFDLQFAFTLGDREDFRAAKVFTVDGADARDFDDALHFQRLDHGVVEVGIHIADVSEFVVEGSALDRWAREAGNSVYLPHKAIPMLPPILSSELCSLKPDEDRYTLSVVVRIDKKGFVLGYRMVKGLIRSCRRLTYDQVAAISLDRDEKSRAEAGELAETLDLGISLARELRRQRIAQGGLDLDLGEAAFRLDENFLLQDARMVRQTDANRMIEAFMCLANECVAAYLNDAGLGIPYRIHEKPKPKDLEQFALFLEALGMDVPESLTTDPAAALNAVIPKLAARDQGQVLQTQLLKALQLAVYHEENRGHFGLGSRCYAHFTSPIRRYADLLVHRRLSAHLAEPGKGPEFFDDGELPEICRHLSGRERAAARAEQSFAQLKQLRLMQNEVGNSFEGVIADVKAYGLFVQFSRWFASGLVPLEQLRDDVYEHIPEIPALVGRKRNRQFRVGDAVRVQVMRVDFIQRRIDLGLQGIVDAPARAVNSKRPTVKKRRTLSRRPNRRKKSRRT